MAFIVDLHNDELLFEFTMDSFVYRPSNCNEDTTMTMSRSRDHFCKYCIQVKIERRLGFFG